MRKRVLMSHTSSREVLWAQIGSDCTHWSQSLEYGSHGDHSFYSKPDGLEFFAACVGFPDVVRAGNRYQSARPESGSNCHYFSAVLRDHNSFCSLVVAN